MSTDLEIKNCEEITNELKEDETEDPMKEHNEGMEDLGWYGFEND